MFTTVIDLNILYKAKIHCRNIEYKLQNQLFQN